MERCSNIYRKMRGTAQGAECGVARLAAWGRRMLLAGVVLFAGSCAWISDDLEPCPEGLRLRFVYDYNMMRADVFRDRVREVTAYVFDTAGILVTARTERDSAALGTYGYEMVFSDLAPGTYRVAAIAFDREAADRAARGGAKFRCPEGVAGDSVGESEVLLERGEALPGRGDTCAVENGGVALDGFWMNYAGHRVEVVAERETRETVGLMYNTKHLTVSLWQLDKGDTKGADIADYDIRLTDRNGRFGMDNTSLPDVPLEYTPYAEWNTFTDYGDGEAQPDRSVAHADLSYPRVLCHEGGRQGARLTIRNRKTGKVVVDMDLPKFLTDGRSTPEQVYSPQEFLDREHTYKMDFFLDGDRWDEVQVTISILSWTVRNHSVDM